MELNHAALEGKKRPNVKMLISRISSQRSDGISLPVKCANNGITRSASDYNRNLCDWCMHARGRKKRKERKDVRDLKSARQAPHSREKGRRLRSCIWCSSPGLKSRREVSSLAAWRTSYLSDGNRFRAVTLPETICPYQRTKTAQIK